MDPLERVNSLLDSFTEGARPVLLEADEAEAILLAAWSSLSGNNAHDMGARGGAKGGRARADALTPTRRVEIAKKAAAARWAKR